MSAEETDYGIVDTWLLPMAEGEEPCGKDFEYDNEFLELNKAAEGKPETQFGPGEPPNWRDVREKSEALMGKTRDLRVALLWVRAAINLDGFSAFSAGVRLLNGLLSNFWDHLHPALDPDDGDPYARVNALAILPQADGLLGDLRRSMLFSVRGVGELNLRSVEIGYGHHAAGAEDTVFTKDQLSQMVAAALSHLPQLPDQASTAKERLAALNATLKERLGSEGAPDLRAISALLNSVQALMPKADTGSVEADVEATGNAGASGNTTSSSSARIGGTVQSRDDALRAISMVCEYLDQTEPSNPAQLLLRRASRLINQNFLQLVKELAPDSLNEVARVMGVDPETISLGS